MTEIGPYEPPAPKTIIMEPVDPDELFKPRRGRPRTKVRPNEVYTPPPTQPKAAGKEDGKPTKESKDKAVKAVTEKLVNDFNAGLIEALTTVGIPEQFLYANGRATVQVVNNQYTPLGNALCINKTQANWMAHGFVEAKEIPWVGKLVGPTSDKEGPSYFWMILGAVGLGSYILQMSKAVNALHEIQGKLKQMSVKIEAQDESNPQENNIERNFADE